MNITISSQRENHIKTNYTIKNPNFFEIDNILNDYNTDNKKNIIYFLSNVTLN